MYPEKDNVGSGKRPSGRLVAGRPKGTGPVMGKFVAPDKENLPKTTKPRAIKVSLRSLIRQSFDDRITVLVF